MSATIWEFFGYGSDDQSIESQKAISQCQCPITKNTCIKTFNDGVVSGVCALKPIKSEPVICCPVRLYAENYQMLVDIAHHAFEQKLELVPGSHASAYTKTHSVGCIAVFGKGWGGELRLPTKSGQGGYFVDWVLAMVGEHGNLVEFIAVEVQTIDSTGNYRNGYESLKAGGPLVKTTAGLNWENVSKRILPQLIYKGQVLQREELCKKGLFFVCPSAVHGRIMARLGGQAGLPKYTLQPASITFVTYDYQTLEKSIPGTVRPIELKSIHSTTVYKVQEAFNNVTLPQENVYKEAILKALGL